MRRLPSCCLFVTAVGLATAAHAEMSCSMDLTPQLARLAEWAEQARGRTALGGIAGDQEYIIPVVNHIVRRTDGTGGLSISNLNQSMEDLNAAFEDAGMQFCQLGEVDYIDDTEYYSEIDESEDIDTLREINNSPIALDIYYTKSLPGLCGVSSFSFMDVQGIVMDNDCTAEDDNPSTLAHEVGHYFDLYHTHETGFGPECVDGSNCAVAGDLICDTPADPNIGGFFDVDFWCNYTGDEAPVCPPFLAGGYEPDPQNYMSYAPDGCRTLFTPMQIQRMRETLLEERPELALLACPTIDFSPNPLVTLASQTPSGTVGGSGSESAHINADGRFIVFASEATDLLAADDTQFTDIYLMDQDDGSLMLVSKNIDGEPGNGDSRSAVITPDGAHIVFISSATNLDDPDSTQQPGAAQVFVIHVATGDIERVSRNGDGDPVNADCDVATLTPDGQIIAYSTVADDIVADDTNGAAGRDVFVYDRSSGITERVSLGNEGQEADGASAFSWDRISMSSDGRYIAFTSFATNLVTDDTNGQADIFVRDREAQTTVRASVHTDGGESNGTSVYPDIAADGQSVAFVSAATTLIDVDGNGDKRDVFLHDLAAGVTAVTALNDEGEQMNEGCSWMDASPDLRFIAYASAATNIAEDGEISSFDIFVHDRATQTSVLASPRGSILQPGNVERPAISGNGTYVAYHGAAGNIVPNDDNGVDDVFSFETPFEASGVFGDLDDDGSVGAADLAMLLGSWGSCPGCPADLDDDGAVGAADLALLLGNWG